MADKYLSFEQFLELAEASLQNEFPQLNPAIAGNWATAFAKSICSSGIAVQSQVKDLERELFPQTATAQYLDRWGTYENLTRNIATKAIGDINQEGVALTVIPAGTIYGTNSNNQYYSTTTETVIQSQIKAGDIDIAASVQVGPNSIVTITTVLTHSLLVGELVTIADVVGGGGPGTFDGIFAITAVIDTKNFQYEKLGPTPATGSGGTYYFSSTPFAIFQVEAEEPGAQGNLSPETELELVQAIPGITDPAIVVNSGIHGGLSEETNEEYRSRIIQSRSELEGVFTIEQIRKAALTVIGNTRAFVVTPNDVESGPPEPGQVAVYVFRDDDQNPLPSATVLAQTKEAIIKYGKLPANTSTNDVFVFAPTLIFITFTFSFISPNTPGMQTAIKAQLKAFFEDSVEFGTDVPQTSYLAAIQNTQDTTNGEFLKTFNLTSPVGDIIIEPGEIAYLGTVTFT